MPDDTRSTLRSIPSSSSTPSSSLPSSSTLLFPFQRLDVYRSARTLAALVHRAAIRDAELRDQATRAAKSAFLNLSEGLPDDRARHAPQVLRAGGRLAPRDRRRRRSRRGDRRRRRRREAAEIHARGAAPPRDAPRAPPRYRHEAA